MINTTEYGSVIAATMLSRRKWQKFVLWLEFWFNWNNLTSLFFEKQFDKKNKTFNEKMSHQIYFLINYVYNHKTFSSKIWYSVNNVWNLKLWQVTVYIVLPPAFTDIMCDGRIFFKNIVIFKYIVCSTVADTLMILI